MVLLKCKKCGKEMEVKCGHKDYCTACRKERDDELSKIHSARARERKLKAKLLNLKKQ